MMTHLFWLSNEAWAAIDPHLPRGKPGKPRVDDRRVISGILHVLKTGCRWRDVPAEYGPATTIYNRYNRCMSPLVTIYGQANGFDVEGNLLMTLSGPGESAVHFP